MALDEAILDSVGKGEVMPTLRLYSWEPACLSLGYAQSIEDVDIRRLEANDWDLVRRPTGGRAILHTDELTYSIAVPIHHPQVRGGILKSYRHLSKGLVAGLEHLGVEVIIQQPGEASEGSRENPVCFEVPSPYEITAGGKKLLGSAQVRRMASLLQHGTLPLRGDISRITQVLAYENEDDRVKSAQQVLMRATTIERVTGRDISWEEAAYAIARGFSEALGFHFDEVDLTPGELDAAGRLEEAHYRNRAWLEKR